MVKDGRFREDLYYRIRGAEVVIPPLRERREDIPLLASHAVGKYAAELGRPRPEVPQPVMMRLVGYDWPGNVRELENVLERAVMFSSGDEIDPDALTGLMHPPEVGGQSTPMAAAVEPSPISQLARAASAGIVSATAVPGVYRVEPKLDVRPRPAASAGQAAAAASGEPAAGAGSEWLTLADVERLHLERTLAATMQNKSLAAKMLGIDRSVLRRKLQRHGLDGPAEAE